MSNKNNSVWVKIACPVELQKDFKLACWLENVSMTDKLLSLINESVIKNQRQIDEAKRVRAS
jgi:hypothetical protein